MEKPAIQGGAILLARKIIESEIWDKPPLYLKVWVYLLARAQHKPFGNLKRGQVFTSIPEIMDACAWKVGYRKETPTKDQVFQVLDWMRKTSSTRATQNVHESNAKATMITITRATHGMLINIDNYGVYQTLANYESNDESNDEKATEDFTPPSEPDNINKNVFNKNDNKDIKPKRLYCRKQVYDESSIPYRLAVYLLKQIRSNYPESKEPNLQKWADEMRLMLERDKRDHRKAGELIVWAAGDEFWRKNILSPAKLRKHWDTLVMTKREEEAKGGRSNATYGRGTKAPQTPGGEDFKISTGGRVRKRKETDDEV